MKLTLKDFQEDATFELRTKVSLMRRSLDDELSAVLLNAPTGSGKTLMATALIEELLAGSEASGDDGDPDLIFLWLTDQPELNLQTRDKMLATSTVLGRSDLVVVDASLDAEALAPGKVYFLNTQKLGANATIFNKAGDNRTYPLWETLANTLQADPTRFVLILDEAHRGSRGADASEAETIMQRFLKGHGALAPVPLVVGISATPRRFEELCSATGRLLRKVDVPPAQVRASGLLKEYVDLFHPGEAQPGHVTMLEEGIRTWLGYCAGWDAFTVSPGEQPVRPVLLVQVADAKKGSSSYSETDLGMVLSTLSKLVPHDTGDLRWIAHAFQDEGDVIVSNQSIRRLAPSAIDGDPDVRVVLFKTSLNTGWDCPRAETMVSFRSAREEDNIAQLVGRMVRTPLARLVDDNEHLNTVALYLPYYDRAAVQKVIARLGADPEGVPPIQGREGDDAVTLTRAPNTDDCFKLLDGLTTYTVPRSRTLKPVPRLAKLAALLAEVAWEADPVKSYRAALVGVLTDALQDHVETESFRRLVDEASVLDVQRHRHDYAARVASDTPAAPATPGGPTTGVTASDGALIRVQIADQNLEDLYAQAGRTLTEGLHKEYVRTRCRDDATVSARDAKLELHALVQTPGVLAKVDERANALRKNWVDAHKAQVKTLPEKPRQVWRAIEGAGPSPEPVPISAPSAIEVRRAKTAWTKHLYVDAAGTYAEDFTSSWERRVVEAETGRQDVRGWLRNRDRKSWSLCIARQEGTKWVGIYPDFIFFRSTKGGLIADIIDPHLLNDQNAPARAAALARYADAHREDFGRIELVIFEKPGDAEGKRLDLVNDAIRQKVAKVKDHAHLQALFEDA